MKRLALLAAVLVLLGAGSAGGVPTLTFERAKNAIHNSTPIDWPILRCQRLGPKRIQCVSRVEYHGDGGDVEVGTCFLMWKRASLESTGMVRVVTRNYADRCQL